MFILDFWGVYIFILRRIYDITTTIVIDTRNLYLYPYTYYMYIIHIHIRY